MNILVLNGSPKGEYSITLQTVRYLEKRHPELTFTVLHVGQRIRSLEKDFAPALEAIDSADALLFSYPVYTFIAPYQLHRFIELMKEHNAPVQGKYATQLSTSKHFYDVTAHRYIQDNAQEMGMKYVRGLSADMDDLLAERGQQEAEAFLARFLWNMENGFFEPWLLAPANPKHLPVSVPLTAAENKSGDIVIIADIRKGDTQLQNMIDRFRAVLCRQSLRFFAIPVVHIEKLRSRFDQSRAHSVDMPVIQPDCRKAVFRVELFGFGDTLYKILKICHIVLRCL